MTLFQSVIQGLIQGLTEFLPVSSSGHLSIYQYLSGQSGEEAALFSVVLHLGTLIAVIVAFWQDIYPLIVEFFLTIRDIIKGDFDRNFLNNNQRMIMLLIVSLLPLIIPYIFKDVFRSVASDNSILLEGICLMITGCLLFSADKAVKGRINASNMLVSYAFIIGIVQAIAPLPGISRSGSTLAIALLLGLSTKFALSFSFIMGIPAVCGALLLDVNDILGSGFSAISTEVLISGLVVSAVSGFFAIFMVRIIAKKRKFKIFAVYTLIVGALVVGVATYDAFTSHSLQTIFINVLGGN